MNAINQWYTDEVEGDDADHGYLTHMRRDSIDPVMKSNRRLPSKRSKSQPTSINGLHRRRNKRFAW